MAPLPVVAPGSVQVPHGPEPVRPVPRYVGENGCWTWFHPAAEGPRGGAPVLICGPIGAEDLSAHRTLRYLAEALAAQGQSAMRFDWPGQGDSAGVLSDEDALTLCTASIHDCVDALRAATGAAQVILVGLRLGASLALQVAVERADVRSCVAVAPVMSGRKMLRQWRMLAVSGPLTRERLDGSLESGGFVYGAKTCKALQALDLSRLSLRPSLSTFVIDRADFPEAGAWVDQQRAAGVNVCHEGLPGYEGMMNVAHLAVVPALILTRVAAWCADQELVAVPMSPTVRSVAAHPLWSSQQAGRAVQETGLWLNVPKVVDSRPLFGVVTSPVHAPPVGSGSSGSWGVLLLSSGAERRIGVSSLYASMSRAWAGQGVTTLRLDLAGLGDSPAWPGESDNRVYSKQASDQIEAALGWLRSRPGVERVMVVGLCSGAFHGLRAAVAGVSMDDLVLLNQAVFLERRVTQLDASEETEETVQHAVTELRRGMGDPRNWRKLLSGKSDLWRIARVLVSRCHLECQRARRRMVRRLGQHVPDDLVLELTRAVAQGTRLHFCFSRHESGLALLRAEFGSSLLSFLARHQSTLTHLSKADHTYSSEEGREEVAAFMAARLGLPSQG